MAGTGENLFIDGLVASDLCIGDVFRLAGSSDSSGSSLALQVASPRRPCEQWNQVHASPSFLEGTALLGTPPQRVDLASGSPYDVTEGNVRHFALTNTLAGFFFRILDGGELAVGDRLVLVSRPWPEWPLKRVGDLLYGQASVAREGWVAWSGTDAERCAQRISALALSLLLSGA